MDNSTAKVSCFARAYHHRNSNVHIFADSVAEALLGDDYGEISMNMTQGINFFMPGFKGTKEEGLRLIVDNQLSPSVLGRSAFCEEMLENQITKGCSQYLIFAAGYDTYATRNHNASAKVYELDLPEVLEDKAERIRKAGISTYANRVPCDLAEEGWGECLQKAGYRTEEKSFGSLLGISYYLDKSEWKKLIGLVGSIMPVGSAICFDYPAEDESRETMINEKLAAGAGELMKAKYSQCEMEDILSDAGFLIHTCLDDKSMTDRYFLEYIKNNPLHPMSAPGGVKYIFALKELKEDGKQEETVMSRRIK